MDGEFPFVIYNHGTTIRPERRLGYNGEEQIALMFSTDGYGVAMPDYVGLGHGERVHLYVHAESEANAGIDMMKAIDEMNTEFNIKRNKLLFTTGYSQGGHASFAAHKYLEELNDGSFHQTYEFGIREEGQKIWSYQEDTEKLLYDFSLMTGDVFTIDENGQTLNLVVASVSSEMIQGVQRKKIKFDYVNGFSGETWYEGVRLEQINLINNFSSNNWLILQKTLLPR